MCKAPVRPNLNVAQYDACRVSCYCAAIGNVLADNRSGSDNDFITDCHARHDDRATTDEATLSDPDRTGFTLCCPGKNEALESNNGL